MEWKVHVEEEGMYNLSLLYYPVEGKSSSIERSIRIDGKLPFQEAGYLQFDRIWDNAKDGIDQDNQGNDQRPKQIERPVWVEAVLKDADGYITEPFLFTLKRRAYRDSYAREPMVIGELKLFKQERADVRRAVPAYEADGIRRTEGALLAIQGEDAVAKSSPTLYPLSERSSPSVSPYSASKVRINTIGGFNWRCRAVDRMGAGCTRERALGLHSNRKILCGACTRREG